MYEKIKLGNIRERVCSKLDELKIFIKYNGDGSYSIREPSSGLKEITIENIPAKNVWIFDNEHVQAMSKLSGKKVEKTILFYADNKLNIIMIEMKETMNADNFKKIKEKCSDSLNTLSLYIAANPDFEQFKEAVIFPISVCCYTEGECEIKGNTKEYNNPNGELSSRTIFNQKFIKDNSREFTIEIDPIFLTRYRIPILFFQNPDTSTSSFTIDFKEIFDKIAKYSE